jgi:hypothetical protein
MRILPIAACAAAVVLSVSAANADTKLPHHKPGLWQNQVTVNGTKQASQQCFDDASETKIEALSLQHCSAHHVTHNADGSWTTVGTCEFQQGKSATTTSTFIGDFNSKLTITAKSDTGAPSSTITSNWIGACKADQKGGDFIGPSGEKVNMIDILSGKQPPQ